MEKKNWKKIEPQIWKPAKSGDAIQGILVNKVRPKEGGMGLSAKYYISNASGEFFLWGTTILDEKLLFVKRNEVVRITFNGKTEYGQNMLSQYTVEVEQTSEAVTEESVEIKG
ncbi:MAG: hypothetical protein MJE63_12690 [Proteobacteria bacterium]|nr:hypothetical protein [Pseudomonadota bacterium]